jgi:transposase
VIWGLAYRHWSAGSGRSRDRHAVDPVAAASDVTAELKRLRRENEMLRQERDILKKATAFFVREGSR